MDLLAATRGRWMLIQMHKLVSNSADDYEDEDVSSGGLPGKLFKWLLGDGAKIDTLSSLVIVVVVVALSRHTLELSLDTLSSVGRLLVYEANTTHR